MSPCIRRHAVASLLLGTVFALGALVTPAGAQITDKPLRIILPVGAGSGVDVIVRSVGPSLTKALGGQSIVIENLPGAGGIIGTAALTQAAPDGMTVAVVSNNHVITPSVYKKIPYDALQDITPISVIGNTPFVLVVNPKLPARNAKELQALLEARPGGYNYASSGNGTIVHLGGEMFAESAGVNMKHIPYKGMGPAIADVIGGQVEMVFAAVPAVQGHLKSGALRAIAATGRQRIASLPDVPTMTEQGFPDVDCAGWFAVIGPAKMPVAQVQRIHDAFVAAFAMPEAKEAMAMQENVIAPTTPEVAAQFFRTEQERYAKIVRRAGVTLD